MTRHRWIPSSLVSSTCSRCGARCTYRGAEVVYGAASPDKCVPPRIRRQPCDVKLRLRTDLAEQLATIAACQGVSVDTALRRMVDDAIARTRTGQLRSKWRRYAKNRSEVAAFVSISGQAHDRLEAVAKARGVSVNAAADELVRERLERMGVR